MNTFSKIKYIIPSKFTFAYIIYIFCLIIGLVLQLLGISSLAPLFITYFSGDFDNSKLLYFLSILNLEKYDQFNIILFFTTSAIIISNLFFLFSAYLSAKIAFSIESKIRSDLLKFYIYSGYSKFIKTGSSSFLSLIVNETQRFTSQVLIPLADILSRAVLVLGILGLLLYMAPKPTIFMILFLGLFYIIFFSNIRKKINSNNTTLSVENKKLIKIINDLIKSFKEIKIYSLENKYSKNLLEVITKIQKIRFFTTFFSISPRYYLEILLFLSLYIFFIFNKKNNLDFVDLSILPVIGYSFIKILPSVQGAFAQYIVVKSNLNSLDEIYKNIIFMKNDKIDENNIVKNKKSNEDKFNDFINLEIIDLKFGYNGKQIFDGFNFKISKGEKIGIIGPSGSGKSTFLYLITGLLNFERGKYYLNNSLIQNNEILNFIKKSFAIIPQNPTLMEDTILNNILLGQKLDEEKLLKAIKFAELTDFIDKLDDGLNTLIHGTNSNLSGGQIQRISIARAFYRNPKIMIIDEGFNQLDDLNEAKLINKIQDFKDLTVITVYHKISSQMKFDNIYYIENLKLKKK